MEEIEADHVIVTIPLGVLKQKHKSLFAPPLPERKVDAIRNLAIGMANKIFLTYDHQWWPDNRTFYVVWNEAQRQLLKVFAQVDVKSFISFDSLESFPEKRPMAFQRARFNS